MLNTCENYLRVSLKMKDILNENLQIWLDFDAKYEKNAFPEELDDYYTSAGVGDSTPMVKDA